VDPVPAGDVVGRRDHAAAVRIPAHHERPLPQLRRLELLDGGEEGVEIEVRDDHVEAEMSCTATNTA
jgi:hypothetical protein